MASRVCRLRYDPSSLGGAIEIPEPRRHACLRRPVVVLVTLCLAGVGLALGRPAPSVAAEDGPGVFFPHVSRGHAGSGDSPPPGGLLAARAYGHTSTRLADGSVLIVGGWPSFSAVERWVPATGRSEPAAPLGEGRTRHVAAPLPDGRVLVAGGEGALWDEDLPPDVFASAEVFDPADQVWHDLPPMNVARSRATAVALADGRVLVVGGWNDRTAEVFDPRGNAWTRVGDLVAEGLHSAVLLADGRVLVVDDPGTGALTTELFDPSTATWRATTPPRVQARLGVLVGLVGGGALLTAGTLAERFDQKGETWHPVSHAPYPLMGGAPGEGASATVLRDGNVLFVGTGPSTRYAMLEPAGDRWMTPGHTHFGHRGHTATLLADGRVLVAGGTYDGADDTATEIYDPPTRRWQTSSSPSQARYRHTGTALESGEVLVVGGRGGAYLARPVVVAPATNRWTVLDSIPATIPAERQWHTATRLVDGRVLVVGGHGAHGVLGSTALFDPTTGRWTATGDLTVPRYLHAAVPLTDGSVLVVGGSARYVERDATSLVERYDPSTGVWRDAGRLQNQRTGLTLALLADGSVLALGGTRRQGGASQAADRYDPATNTWRPAADLPAGRFGHTATVLRDGQVLVAGGCCGEGDALGEDDTNLYDPRTDTWRKTGRLNIARSEHSAHLLPDGRVLVAGGCCADDANNSAEIYDPRAGTWQVTGRLHESRVWASATSLSDGTVVVIGGCCATGLSDDPLDSLERYDVAKGTWQLVERAVDAPAPALPQLPGPTYMRNSGR